MQCTVEEECKMFAQNVAEFLVSVQISVERGKISAGVERSLCLPFTFYFWVDPLCPLVILGVIVFLRGTGVNLWWDCSVGTVVCTNCKSWKKASLRSSCSVSSAHSTAYIFPIGPLSCHLELLKVTLLHGCIYKEIPHSGSVSRGKRRPPSLNSCLTLQAKPSASQVRPSKYWCYTKLQSNSFYQSEPNQQVGFK